MFSRFRLTLAPIIASLFIPAMTAPAADLNLVGSEMVRMLQNGHYGRLAYDQKLGTRFLNEYLEAIDPQKVYFTQTEVDVLRKNYGSRFQDLLTAGEALPVAQQIFDLYRSRVREQVASFQKILKEEKFTFDSDSSINTDRDDLPWPKDLAEMRTLWRLDLEDLVLSEIIRREQIDHLAKSQEKESPFINDPTPAEKISLRYDRFIKAVNESSPADVANYLFSAVARSHDPHCEYQSPREHEQFTIAVSNQLVGIGASLQAEDDGATKIRGIVNGGPADIQGDLQLGDRIIAVDSLNNGNFESVLFLPIGKVVEKILGKEDTEVGLKVSEGSSLDAPGHVIVIKRGKITIKEKLVTAKIREFNSGKKLGIIDIPSFYFPYGQSTKSVSDDLEAVLKRMMKENVDGIALDLRSNGGGSLDEVVRLAGFFVPGSRVPIVQAKSTSGYTEPLKAPQRRPLYTGPLVMLTSKGSASATEILAAALQDYNRAVIIGESSTYGKGSIQRNFDISNQMPVISDRENAGHIKFTTGKYYRVTGGSVQQRGVVSDVVLPGISDAGEYGEAFAEYALPYDMIRKAAGFEPLNKRNLFLPLLQEKSEARLAQDQDFTYLRKDIARLTKENEESSRSLNIETRRQKLAEGEERRSTRNAERRARFAKMEEEDKKSLTSYRLTLDDIEEDSLPIVDTENDDQTYMRSEKSKIAALDDTPEWPSGIDPVERESLNVLRDLAEVIKANRVAGTLRTD
ncbi:carboxy terminal-processing peptidase [Akkermansiaceae bacterium]|nr:carboxy terminal-processing peptidase [Akkermansiaceae bacterium]MDB4143754.1 carboxy terminal-processing peptidase [Akkermansiaceae bacterium]MDB4259522.1 carboxy terminal-processing peptidase [Akkermansiaceae bacterium]MDB4274712.1 carboxy terminal-processing peptidase [Akkermansiaceae bacterium]MDB4499192.1 carboxy terminal-processing peptidase [Akkermansiaceae bacterium]